jgi:hypothetical protein
LDGNSKHFFGIETSFLISATSIAKRDSIEIKYHNNPMINLLFGYYYKFHIYNDFYFLPTMKLGFSWGGMNFNNKTVKDSISIRDINKNTVIKNDNLINNSIVIFAGFNFSYQIKSWIETGLEIGYLYAIPNWNFTGYKLADMPNYLLKGIIINLYFRSDF